MMRAGRTPPIILLNPMLVPPDKWPATLSPFAPAACTIQASLEEVPGVRSHHALRNLPIRCTWFGNGPVSVDRWTTSASESAKACGMPELFTVVLSALTASNRVSVAHPVGIQRTPPSHSSGAKSLRDGTTAGIDTDWTMAWTSASRPLNQLLSTWGWSLKLVLRMASWRIIIWLPFPMSSRYW